MLVWIHVPGPNSTAENIEQANVVGKHRCSPYQVALDFLYSIHMKENIWFRETSCFVIKLDTHIILTFTILDDVLRRHVSPARYFSGNDYFISGDLPSFHPRTNCFLGGSFWGTGTTRDGILLCRVNQIDYLQGTQSLVRH